jgi:hypothetical protein
VRCPCSSVAGLGRTHEDVGGVSGGRGSHLLLLLQGSVRFLGLRALGLGSRACVIEMDG